MNEFKAVILDMDGVITHTAKAHARAWKQTFDEFLEQQEGAPQAAFDIERDYRRYVDGRPRYDGVRTFLQSRGIELPFGQECDAPGERTICGLGNRKNALFHEVLERDGVEVYEDAVEQIDKWRRAGLRVAVISSSRNCEAVLKAARLLDLFDAKLDGNDVARDSLPGKPAPDMFLRAAKQFAVEPGEVVVVEDSIAGVEAGRRGGFGMVVGVARNREDAALQQAGADCVVHDLREIKAAGQDAPGHDRPRLPRSAIEHLDEIAARINGKELALFLDYDGTLTPIVRRPEEATLDSEMRSLLLQLGQRCSLAIVSGRDRRNAEEMVQVDSLVYAGSHGFDIRGPNGLEMQQEDARQALPELDEAERELRQLIEPIRGAHVERKRFAIAVHFREVSSEAAVRQVERAVDETASKHSGLRKRGGKRIFELQPDVPWDKGQAVLWLTEALGLDPAGVAVIYIGDDVTDEDAFRVLHMRDNGIGIRVAAPTMATHASYYLADCDAVKTFLKSLLEVLQQQKSNHD